LQPRRSVTVTRRSQSAVVRKDKFRDKSQPDLSFSESLCQYYRDIADKSELNLQQCSVKESSNQRVKSSGIRRKLPLTQGQQMYLLGKYNVNNKPKKKRFVFIL
jgi:hypothetical protein